MRSYKRFMECLLRSDVKIIAHFFNIPIPLLTNLPLLVNLTFKFSLEFSLLSSLSPNAFGFSLFKLKDY